MHRHTCTLYIIFKSRRDVQYLCKCAFAYQNSLLLPFLLMQTHNFNQIFFIKRGEHYTLDIRFTSMLMFATQTTVRQDISGSSGNECVCRPITSKRNKSERAGNLRRPAELHISTLNIYLLEFWHLTLQNRTPLDPVTAEFHFGININIQHL